MPSLQAPAKFRRGERSLRRRLERDEWRSAAAIVDMDSWSSGDEILRRFEGQSYVVIAFAEASSPQHWLARAKVPNANGEFPAGAY